VTCAALKVGDYEIPEDLLYTKNHEWLRTEQDRCRIGITDYAQKSLHDIVFVELPSVGAKIVAGQTLGSVESVKAVADVFAPVSGEVLEANIRLAEMPELLNQQPYQDGWIAIVTPTNLGEERKVLLDAKSYAGFLETQIT
jgi:glycine cleavage system H protein